MCGICGIINFNGKPVDEGLLKKMNNLLYHRGPDEEGYYINSEFRIKNSKLNVGLGVRQLSIIDLEGGSQPIYNEDKSIAIVFDGKIYNFPELKKDLEKRHRFYTRTDTEVIIHLYEDYGVDCLKYLRGIFAFAIWDSNKNQLFAAVDRLSQKPLYYTRINGNFYFASEMKSFLIIPEFKKEINLKAIHYYLTYQYIPAPMTIWQSVERLTPASFFVLNKYGRMKIEKYWNIDFRKKTNLSFNEAKEKIKVLLKDATKARMIADVPLGAFLSGGHDSSIIVGLMSELSSKPVQTFSIGFKEAEFSELKYARIVAKRFNTDHHEFIVEPDYIDILPKIVWHYDQPYADSSALPSYYVAKMTREHVKVALNGDGGDENFAGYLRYSALKISQILSLPFYLIPTGFFNRIIEMIPSVETTRTRHPFRYAKRFFSAMNTPPARRNIIWHCFFDNESKYRIYSPYMKERFAAEDSFRYLENLFKKSPACGVIDRALYTDINAYLPQCLSVKMDIATMANSLESRSPFLDHHLLEFTAQLPSKWKMRFFDKKYILKNAFKDMLPEEIISRRKQGFGIPLGKWFKNQWKDYFQETVLSHTASRRGYFDMKEINKLFDEHINGGRDNGYRLWALLMLELWHRVFIDGEAR